MQLRHGRARRGAVLAAALALAASGPAAATAPAHAAATLTLTSPVLVFDQGSTRISLTTDQTSVSYRVTDEAGAPVTSGTLAVSGGAGALDLGSLGPGYYHLSVTAGTTTVPTEIGVLGGFAPGTATRDQRFGMDVHFGHQPNDATLFALMGRIGFTHTRSDLNWSAIEQSPGEYSWGGYVTDTDVPLAAQNGLTPLLVAGYSNKNYDGGYTPYTQAGWDAFGRFIDAGYEHFSGYTKDVEVYNEFNGGFDTAQACARTVGDKVRCYLGMLKAAHQAVKVDGGHADANLIGPVSAGIDQPWITGLLDGGALDYLDTFSFHQYAGANPETAYAAVPWLRQQIRDHHGGTNMPLWITETGDTVMPGAVTDADQADFAVRLPVLAFAAGVDRYFWYDFLNDGSDPTNKEHNFGQLRQPTTGVVGNPPKPSLVTQATVLRQIGGLPLTGSDDLAAPAYSYRFGTTTRVMWATTPTTVRVAATKPLTVTDEYGRASTYTPVGGSVTLGLDKHPVYVRGASGVSVTTNPGVTATVPGTSNTAETIPVTVTNRERHPVNGTVGHTGFTVAARASTTVQVPTTGNTGERNLVASAGVGPLRTVRIPLSTSVVAATRVTVAPKVAGTDPVRNQLAVTVTNNRRATALPVASVYWHLTDGSTYLGRGTETGVPDVAPGTSVTVTVDVPALSTWDQHWYYTKVTTSGGAEVAAQGWTGWNPVEADGAAHAPPIDLGRQVARTYPGGYGGAADLSGTLRPSYTADGLVVTADVTDDVFRQAATDPSQLWSGDSIQFAVTPTLPGLSTQRVEVGAGLLPSGPAVYTWSPPPGQSAGTTPGATATVTRDGTTTHYRIAVPWASLGLAARPAAPFGMSVVVNDSDGAARNWVTWGDGITTTKSSVLLRPVQIV